MKERIYIKIYGDVQGVGFRFSLRQQADALGLAGYVKNCIDGSVEIEAEGEKEALKELLEFTSRGPSMARVEKLEHSWVENKDEFNNFNSY